MAGLSFDNNYLLFLFERRDDRWWMIRNKFIMVFFSFFLLFFCFWEEPTGWWGYHCFFHGWILFSFRLYSFYLLVVLVESLFRCLRCPLEANANLFLQGWMNWMGEVWIGKGGCGTWMASGVYDFLNWTCGGICLCCFFFLFFSFRIWPVGTGIYWATSLGWGLGGLFDLGGRVSVSEAIIRYSWCISS